MALQTDDAGNHPRLLMLASPAAFADELPNLGDRALQSGFNALVRDDLPTARILHDGWNTFPLETYRHVQKFDGPVEQAIETSFETFKRRAETHPPLHKTLNRILHSPAFDRFPLMTRLNSLARHRTGQNFRQAIAPRLFPKLAAWQFAAKLKASEVAIFNAGGLLSDHLAHYLPGRILSLFAAKRAGLKVVIVNFSFAIENEALRRLVRATMQAVDLHVVRESHSRDALTTLGVDENRIILTRDTAFNADFASTEPAMRKPRIALFVRGDRAVDIQTWATLARWMRRELDVGVIYLHGCHKNDVAVRIALGENCALDDDGVPLNNSDTMRALSECAFAVSDRYHGLIFAMQAEVPFAAVESTTHKTAGLLKDFEYSLPALPTLTADSLDQYKAAIGEAYNSREALAQELSGKAAAARTKLIGDYRSVFDKLGLMNRT
ncbi:MAG: hypothetical protein GKS00_17925 [Alphaproteobacteria bacterium]|nr:hypothetical protein [Alphaproteobacteria bacterium]